MRQSLSMLLMDETNQADGGSVDAPVVMNLHQLPAPPAYFKGRVSELQSRLAQEGMRGINIYGLEGVGKCTLALVLANALRRDYPDAHFFIRLRKANGEPLSSEAVMARVIHSFRPTASLPKSEVGLYGLYLSILYDKRTLFLFDDAVSREQVERLLPPPGSVLLLTSRQSLSLPKIHSIQLNPMPVRNAERVLGLIAPRLREEAPALAQSCAYLPLAITLAGHALACLPALPVNEYIKRLSEAQEQMDASRATIAVNYGFLSERLQARWRLLALFFAEFDQAAAAAVWQVSQEEAGNTLEKLAGYGMVQAVQRSEPGSVSRYQLHHLLHSFADANLSDEEPMVASWRYASHYRHVLEMADELYLDGKRLEGLALFDREWLNIQAGQAWAALHSKMATSGTIEDSAAQLCSDYAHAGAYILSLRRRATETIRWLEAALAAARHLKRCNHANHANQPKDLMMEALHLGNLGLAYVELGDLQQAIGFYNEALEISRECKDQRAEGDLLGNLGLAYKSLAEWSRAISYFEQWLAIMCELGERRSEGYALGNLGLAYMESGETEQAIECYQRRLDIARDLKDKRAEGNVLGYLGLAYAKQGKWVSARQLCEEWLMMARQLMDQQAEANALGHLGNIYVSLGELPLAIQTYQRYQAMARQDGNRQALAQAYGGLGVAYQKQGQTQLAIDHYQQWLSMAQKIKDQHEQVDALTNLGMIYQSQGDITPALQYYQQALEITQLCGDRSAEGALLWNMSLALDRLGQRDQAITQAQKALVIHEEIHDPWTPKVRERLVAWAVGA